IATLTGAQVVAPEVGLKLDQVGLEVLGTARRVTVTKDNTTIVDGGGDGEEIAGRIRQIKAEIEDTDSDWDREKLQERLANLAGGQGYNAATEEYGDLITTGVVDPVKVTRSALANAASIAAMLLTTETLVADKPEDSAEGNGGGHGHGHGHGH